MYVGSTLSLWWGITVYGLKSYLDYMRSCCKKNNNSSKANNRQHQNLLKRARRLLNRSFSRLKSTRTLTNKTMDNSLLSYRSAILDANLEREDKINYKDKLAFNYDQNIDLNYKNKLTYYNNQPIKFIILDKRVRQK